MALVVLGRRGHGGRPLTTSIAAELPIVVFGPASLLLTGSTPYVEEADLALITTTSPTALAADVEITLPAGYALFEVRITGLPTTDSVNNGAIPAVSDAGGYGSEGAAVVISPQLYIIDPLVAQACHLIGGGTIHAGHNGTLTKIRFSANGTGSGDTFTGAGTIWLYGIPSA